MTAILDSKRVKDGIGTIGLLFPAVLFLAVFFLAPLGKLFHISLTDPAGTLAAYNTLVTNEVFRQVFLYTLQTGVVVTVACILLACPAAYLLTKLRGVVLSVAIYCVLVPFWISVLVRTFSWMLLLERGGPVNSALVSVGILQRPVQMLFNDFSVYVGMVHVLLPYAVLPIYAAMLRVDGRLLQASEGLGAPAWTTLRRIYLPLILPGILAAGAFVMLLSLGFYVTPALLGGRQNMMVATLIDDFVNHRFAWHLAAAASFLLLAAVLAILVIVSRLVPLNQMWAKK